ncbi:MAG: PaaI family thioesterase [Candidatus Eremiobacteraeota bacterium]|nr:PaaI family thioesterase [Candidatus Eremiobacteraeota bacterium]
MNSSRSHTIRWGDPTAGPKAARNMTGIEYLRAMKDGTVPGPPIASLMDLRFEAIEPGHLVFTGRPFEFHFNPMGQVHGGFASTLLDSALGCVTMTLLPKGMIFTTLDLHVNFVRPLTLEVGELRCIGDVVHGGRRVVTSFGRIEDRGGKLYAHANSTCMVIPWPE